MYNFRGKFLLILSLVLLPLGCSSPRPEQSLIQAEYPIHLEELIKMAGIVGSEVPKTITDTVEWRFNKPQPDWKPVISFKKSQKPVEIVQTQDSLRLILNEGTKYREWALGSIYSGGIWINVPDWRREDWAYIIISARAKNETGSIWMGGAFNLREKPGSEPGEKSPFLYSTEYMNIINDGEAHTYIMRADWSWGEYAGEKKWEGPWKQLGIEIGADKPANIDLLSVVVIPKEAKYAGTPVGLNTEVRNNAYRQTLFSHAPGQIAYQIRVPEAGRLDFALGVLRDDTPVTFRISAQTKDKGRRALFEETYADKEHWAQRSVDLSGLAGKTVSLALEAESERAGTIALWAAPTITGARPAKRPNVILYIIDGAAAENMSVYGYNRRTTPNLERLASEGAVFDYAYSNSSWTKISVPSFMTSLHSSVLGPFKNESDPVPQQAVIMAQHMHGAGYQTAVFVSNPHCGTMSGLDRGVDVLREAGVKPNSKSSEELHRDFWKWREEYPGRPYWVHIQPTDVHMPRKPSEPFAGLYVDPELQKTLEEWRKKLREVEGLYTREERFEKAGIDRARFLNVDRGLYDETMAHQDYQIGNLVERLKAAGEWDHTLFIVAADHSHSSAGLGLLDPMPPPWGTPNLASHVSRIPMIIIWPEKIAPGQRLSQPVSMIDILPTILDLAGLPEPRIMQGQSLAPLLLGEDGWELKPIIFDEFNIREDNGETFGTIDVIDGRWGASLKIGKSKWEENEKVKRFLRPAPMLLYDIWDDPHCLNSLHKERPDLVKKYTKFLEDRWKEHQALAKNFSRTGEVPLTPEQIETLRSLGYIR